MIIKIIFTSNKRTPKIREAKTRTDWRNNLTVIETLNPTSSDI